MSKQIMQIPQGARLKQVTIAGKQTSVLDFNVRRRGKKRVSKETKALQRAARKRIKVPILLVGAVGVGVSGPLFKAMDEPTISGKFKRFTDGLGQNYFGINRISKKWEPEKAIGTISLLVWGGLEGLGIVQKVNRRLGTSNIPFVRL